MSHNSEVDIDYEGLPMGAGESFLAGRGCSSFLFVFGFCVFAFVGGFGVWVGRGFVGRVWVGRVCFGRGCVGWLGWSGWFGWIGSIGWIGWTLEVLSLFLFAYIIGRWLLISSREASLIGLVSSWFVGRD